MTGKRAIAEGAGDPATRGDRIVGCRQRTYMYVLRRTRAVP